jgi:hypothetical protein
MLDKGRLVGIVSLKDLRFLQLKLELEERAEENRPPAYWHDPSRHQTPSHPK